MQVETELLLVQNKELLNGCPAGLPKTVNTEAGTCIVEAISEAEVMMGSVQLDTPTKGAAVGIELHETDTVIAESPTNVNREHPTPTDSEEAEPAATVT